MSALETDVLAELIGEKRQSLSQWRDMGRRQLELIEAGDVAAVLDVLAAKQRLLAKVQRIEKQLDPFRDQDPESRQWRTPEDRRLCAEQVRQCEKLWREIVTQEKCSEGALIKRRDEAATRLQGAHHAAQARGAYTAPPVQDINQLDLHSGT